MLHLSGCRHTPESDGQSITLNSTQSRYDKPQTAKQTKPQHRIYLGKAFHSDLDALTCLDYFERYIVHSRTETRKTGDSSREKFGHFFISWTSRDHVAPIYHMSPYVGDIFFLRLLLSHEPARVFHQLRTHGVVVDDTFQEAAGAMGLVMNTDTKLAGTRSFAPKREKSSPISSPP